MLGFTKQPGVSNISSINTVMSVAEFFGCNITMMPGSKGQKAVHACMIRLLNLGPAKHEEGVICIANQRIPNVCRIAGAACCGAIRNEIFRGHQLGQKTFCPQHHHNIEISQWRMRHEISGYAL